MKGAANLMLVRCGAFAMMDLTVCRVEEIKTLYIDGKILSYLKQLNCHQSFPFTGIDLRIKLMKLFYTLFS